MRKGEVFWFDPDPTRGSEQAGRRPCVLMSRETINRASPVVVVVPVTTYQGQRLYPSDVLVQAPEGGLKNDSVALGLQVRAVDKHRLAGRLGALGPATVLAIERTLLDVFDIAPEDHVAP